MANDPLGFSRQTATILRGLGADDLIAQCEKRNVSTDTLHRLTKQDLVTLGAEEEKAEELWKALSVHGKSTADADSNNLQNRIDELEEIAASGERQLSLLAAYIAYARLRLQEEKINVYINADRALAASDVLPLAVEATLTEIEETEANLGELVGKISQKKQTKHPHLSIVICVFAVTALTASLVWTKRPIFTHFFATK